jgi:small subunit ribosomal protein S20
LANTKSAIKRVDITARKNLHNRMISSGVKTAVKNFDKALASDDKNSVQTSYVSAVKALDKAAAKGVLHKNTAARKKAQLAIKLNPAK